jgi:hypothetical protein
VLAAVAREEVVISRYIAQHTVYAVSWVAAITTVVFIRNALKSPAPHTVGQVVLVGY